MQSIRLLLLPLSWMYGAITFLRNKFYDWGIFKTVEFSESIISVGNLSAGGTGKTPMIEYLIELFQDHYKIATLSRGYKRKTRGFYLATSSSTAADIGDEPLQFKQKYASLLVAVDANRKRGIEQLKALSNDLQLILLDDAFQHRKVRAGLSIVLSDYSNLYYTDRVLPAGNLREFASGIKRADIIIVTKTPPLISPIEKRIILKKIHLLDYQRVYFSFIRYGDPIAINKEHKLPDDVSKTAVLLLCGIANPTDLQKHLTPLVHELKLLQYADHHDYTVQDMLEISAEFEKLPAAQKLIITTEKDYMRLQKSELDEWVKKLPLFYIPIKTDFNEKEKEELNLQLANYVRRN